MPAPGGLVYEVAPGVDPVDGGVVMIPALGIANAEVDRLVGTFSDLQGSSAALYSSGLTDVLAHGVAGLAL
jgi:hypothetical protein